MIASTNVREALMAADNDRMIKAETFIDLLRKDFTRKEVMEAVEKVIRSGNRHAAMGQVMFLMEQYKFKPTLVELLSLLDVAIDVNSVLAYNYICNILSAPKQY